MYIIIITTPSSSSSSSIMIISIPDSSIGFYELYDRTSRPLACDNDDDDGSSYHPLVVSPAVSSRFQPLRGPAKNEKGSSY